MNEAEIAQLVAEAVAAHDGQTTFMEELSANIETIAVLFLAAMSAGAAVIGWFWKLDKRLTAVEGYRETHDREDREAHGRLEQGDQEVLRALRELGADLKESAQRGDEGRAKLHERVEAANRDIQEIGKTVQRLVGFQEAAQQAKP